MADQALWTVIDFLLRENERLRRLHDNRTARAIGEATWAAWCGWHAGRHDSRPDLVYEWAGREHGPNCFPRFCGVEDARGNA